jgi:hypothetical protein
VSCGLFSEINRVGKCLSSGIKEVMKLSMIRMKVENNHSIEFYQESGSRQGNQHAEEAWSFLIGMNARRPSFRLSDVRRIDFAHNDIHLETYAEMLGKDYLSE